MAYAISLVQKFNQSSRVPYKFNVICVTQIMSAILANT